MKKLIALFVAVVICLVMVADGCCAIKYISPYIRSNGTYVGGHFRDTSCDGNPYNNANYLGLND